ncbi:MAG: DUF5671 domain-containing protein [Acidobacteriota bacterium]|nr:DUF5671 domain-containing protein [Acidobacteriota bacterium]
MEPQTTSNLREFIQASKNKGASDEFLVALLARRGWPADDVYTGLGEYWAGATGIAVPERGKSNESSREAFLYLLAFSTLCCWATALGSAMFIYIDRWFPDAVSGAINYSGTRSSVTWQMATLAVSFPIFLLIMRTIVSGSAAHPEQLQSGIQKWLTYIALLGTAGTMIGDLIWFFNYLLAGEITARFFLKSAVVMAICGAIFFYYLRSLRPRQEGSAQWHRAFAAAAAIAVAAVFIIGVTLAGTPGQIRMQEADLRRSEALKQLGSAIEARYQNQINQGQTANMPATLIQLVQDSRVLEAQTRDPQTQTLYEYNRAGGSRYEICANFSYASTDGDFNVNGSAFWRHRAGRTCYALDASRPVPF